MNDEKCHSHRLFLLIGLLSLMALCLLYLGLRFKARYDIAQFIHSNDIVYDYMQIDLSWNLKNPIIVICFQYRHQKKTGVSWPRDIGLLWHARPWGEVVFDKPILEFINSH